MALDHLPTIAKFISECRPSYNKYRYRCCSSRLTKTRKRLYCCRTEDWCTPCLRTALQRDQKCPSCRREVVRTPVVRRAAQAQDRPSSSPPTTSSSSAEGSHGTTIPDFSRPIEQRPLPALRLPLSPAIEQHTSLAALPANVWAAPPTHNQAYVQVTRASTPQITQAPSAQVISGRDSRDPPPSPLSWLALPGQTRSAEAVSGRDSPDLPLDEDEDLFGEDSADLPLGEDEDLFGEDPPPPPPPTWLALPGRR